MATGMVFLSLLALSFSAVVVADQSPLQDFCVADSMPHVLVNGLTCKDPRKVTSDDFFFSGLHIARNTSNTFGISVIRVSVTQIPGLNTLGISFIRIDYAPWGVIPPHSHARASEIITVVEGSLEVGFITSSPERRHIKKVLKKGDVFVFPQSLIHYSRNVGDDNVIIYGAFSSQNPGFTIASAVFGAKPHIDDDVLAKAFQLDKDIVKYLQAKF